MNNLPVILVFDVGKTNKKIILFDEQYVLVHEESTPFDEIKDEDGFPCDDVQRLTNWITDSFATLLNDKRFLIKAINFSGYGASFVYINDQHNVFLPLYNYLKPFPELLKSRFYNQYGGEQLLSRQTASPVLGHLNSGLQLYRLKYEKQAAFTDIQHALHLPQYLSFILSGNAISEITSIGCHTLLWDFEAAAYHRWVSEERIVEKLPPVLTAESIAGYANKNIPVGTGIHDSSAALIPYLASFQEPFILLSTGTWCISLNPFNTNPLTDAELQQDCLCYLTYKGQPVKASRLFAGYAHEQQVKNLAGHFNKPDDYYKTVAYDRGIVKGNNQEDAPVTITQLSQPDFSKRDLGAFNNYEEAYHQLITDIIHQQVISTNLVLKGTAATRIFVDGGFSKNQLYMHLLAEAFPTMEIYAASVAQASALGAAMAIHTHWNSQPFPAGIIELKLYSVKHTVGVSNE